ncbi:MAG: asparagine synthase (glutamine-hydrolyzing) [Myxococcales bacterium]|nr:asparagine synthase (glutamine-hydrolyzing) [Myxococcales bacterium]
MCGICGIAYADSGRQVGQATLQAMMDVLVHRGPDDSGSYVDGPVGLGHRRLSIMDVAGGHQPMANEDESLWLIGNGEIYNHPQLSAELAARGHSYRTRSDTETILHHFEESGPLGLSGLRGMFAFALWDVRERRLVLARDRLGIKPLYYATTPDGDLAWASEIKALFRTGLVRPTLNVAALPEYLCNRYTTGRTTLFEDVFRVLPGHFIVWHDGRWREEPYWSLSEHLQGSTDRLSAAAYRDAFETRFRDAVQSHLMSDVPLGVFLSGGLDSSAVAITMHELVGSRLNTFSVGYDEGPESELGYARSVAEHIGSNHHEVTLSAHEFFEALPRLLWHEDEPIAFPSSISLYFVARLAADSVKVVLTGEGSDELLAGYGKYLRTVWNVRLGQRYERLPGAAQRRIRQLIHRLPDKHRVVRRLKRTFLARPVDPEALYFDSFGVFGADHTRQLLNPDLLDGMHPAEVDPFAEQRRLWIESADASLLNRLLYVDTLSYLHELLMKQDQMSMAASLESRVPFLDNELIEFAFGLPDDMKLKGTRSKLVLRDIMEPRLPKEILSRSKMGFPTPVGRWLTGAARGWLEDCALSSDRLTAHFFDPSVVRRLAHEHVSGYADHTERLWSIVNVELWARTYPQIATGQ